MKIESVLDPAFAAYGQVVTGLEEARAKILAALAGTPQPAAGTDYCPEDPSLQELPAAAEVSEHLFGGMPCQLGWCNGRNTKLNCLEYHRDSEFNLANEDFILLLARRDEIENGRLDTGKVRAFRVPAGTNTAKPDIAPKADEDAWLWACNKWLLAHPDSAEAAQGAAAALVGENIDIAADI